MSPIVLDCKQRCYNHIQIGNPAPNRPPETKLEKTALRWWGIWLRSTHVWEGLRLHAAGPCLCIILSDIIRRIQRVLRTSRILSEALSLHEAPRRLSQGCRVWLLSFASCSKCEAGQAAAGDFARHEWERAIEPDASRIVGACQVQCFRPRSACVGGTALGVVAGHQGDEPNPELEAQPITMPPTPHELPPFNAPLPLQEGEEDSGSPRGFEDGIHRVSGRKVYMSICQCMLWSSLWAVDWIWHGQMTVLTGKV